MMNKGLSQAIS
jgi:hypothetical protein